MTYIAKKIKDMYFLDYPVENSYPTYIEDYKELVTYTGMRKSDIVYKINNSYSNFFSCLIDGKLHTIYYFL